MLNTLSLRLLLASAGLALLASPARAQNPVVPGQSPLRRLSAPAAQPAAGPTGPGLALPGSRSLDSLRTLSGRYHALTPDSPMLVLFDVMMGYARPLGNFADSPAGGGATQGGTLSIGAAYLFTKHLGVFGALGGGVHGVREEAISRRLGLTAQNAAGISYGQVGWSHVAFVVGPQFTLPLGRLALDVRPGVGLTYVVSPRYNATFTDPATGTEQHQFVSSAAAFALAGQLGASLRLPLGERLGLRLGAEYFYARPAFNDYNANTTLILVESYTRRPVSFMQFVAGLVVRFE